MCHPPVMKGQCHAECSSKTPDVSSNAKYLEIAGSSVVQESGPPGTESDTPKQILRKSN